MILRSKHFLSLFSITVLLGVVFYILWIEEFQFVAPISKNEQLEVSNKSKLTFLKTKPDRPIFLHFFESGCTNSRINIDHLDGLTADYRTDYDFYIVSQNSLSEKEIRERFEVPDYISILEDASGSLSKEHGVQTTPYALIINLDSSVYFHGNYTNQNGLCGPEDINWSAPGVALKYLKSSIPLPLFPEYQRGPRGCRIPKS